MSPTVPFRLSDCARLWAWHLRAVSLAVLSLSGASPSLSCAPWRVSLLGRLLVCPLWTVSREAFLRVDPGRAPQSVSCLDRWTLRECYTGIRGPFVVFSGQWMAPFGVALASVAATLAHLGCISTPCPGCPGALHWVLQPPSTALCASNMSTTTSPDVPLADLPGDQHGSPDLAEDDLDIEDHSYRATDLLEQFASDLDRVMTGLHSFEVAFLARYTEVNACEPASVVSRFSLVLGAVLTTWYSLASGAEQQLAMMLPLGLLNLTLDLQQARDRISELESLSAAHLKQISDPRRLDTSAILEKVSAVQAIICSQWALPTSLRANVWFYLCGRGCPCGWSSGCAGSGKEVTCFHGEGGLGLGS